MLVDTHMHTWRYPDHVNKRVMLRSEPVERRHWTDEQFKPIWDGPIERYFEEAEGLVDKSIMLSLRTGETFSVNTPNEYLADLKRKYPDKLEWCCAVNPLDPKAPGEVEKCVKEWGAIGVGEFSPAYQGFSFNDERCFPVYEKAIELGVPVVTHAGPAQPRDVRMSLANIFNVDDVAIKYPDLKIVICHMGYYKYEDTVHLLQKHDNVFADISWLVSLAGIERTTYPSYLPVVQFPYFHLLLPLLYYFSQTFGSTDKLIWGSDWVPFSSPPKGRLNDVNIIPNLNEWLRKYNLPEIPEEKLRNILHENWKKVYPDIAKRKGA